MTLIDGQTQGYDLAGNVTLAYSADRGTSYVYKYDHHNRLTAVWDSAESTRKAAFTYDALGRRIEHVNDVLGTTTRYYYDGVNEIVETDGSGNRSRYYIHGISYVDERLMMMDYKDTADGTDDRPYYYTLDRMYNVRFLVDRAGALVERYMYDAYGRPHIRESCGRGDMDNETTLTSTDDTRFTAAKNATIWDPRADMDDDGDVDANDQTAFDTKVTEWPPPTFGAPNVEWAFSKVGNPFMFQGRPHFALDTAADATEGVLMLNDHRARMNDPVTGRWITRDPLWWHNEILSPILAVAKHPPLQEDTERRRDVEKLYVFLQSQPTFRIDWTGLCPEPGQGAPPHPDGPPALPPGVEPFQWKSCEGNPDNNGIVQCGADGQPTPVPPPGICPMPFPTPLLVVRCGACDAFLKHEELHISDINIYYPNWFANHPCEPGQCLAVNSAIEPWYECRGYMEALGALECERNRACPECSGLLDALIVVATQQASQACGG